MTTTHWGIVLVAVALLTIGLQVRRWRLRQITALQFAAGLVARVGFLVLGLIYVTGYVYDQPRAPLYGLGVVGAGIVLNLTAGVIENVRRARAPFVDEDPDDISGSTDAEIRRGER